MRTLATSLVLVLVAGGGIAAAQYYDDYGGYGGYIDNRASTVGEGYARGMADVIRSQGMYNLSTSEAAINMTEAARRDMKNRDRWTDTYFGMRQKNRDYRAAERRPRATREDWIRYAQMGKPRQLSPSELDRVTGDVQWPRLLMQPQFASYRAELDPLFAKRAEYGESTWDDYMRIDRKTKEMQAELKKMIKHIPPQDYMAAKRFLEGLNYENKLPAS